MKIPVDVKRSLEHFRRHGELGNLPKRPMSEQEAQELDQVTRASFKASMALDQHVKFDQDLRPNFVELKSGGQFSQACGNERRGETLGFEQADQGVVVQCSRIRPDRVETFYAFPSQEGGYIVSSLRADAHNREQCFGQLRQFSAYMIDVDKAGGR